MLSIIPALFGGMGVYCRSPSLMAMASVGLDLALFLRPPSLPLKLLHTGLLGIESGICYNVAKEVPVPYKKNAGSVLLQAAAVPSHADDKSVRRGTLSLNSEKLSYHVVTLLGSICAVRVADAMSPVESCC